MRGNKWVRALGILLALVALKGLVGLIAGTANGMNLGIFLCPGVLSAVLLYKSRPKKE